MCGWKKGKLTDIAEIIMGQSPSGESCNLDSKGTPLLNGPTEFGIRNPLPVQYTIDPKKTCKEGDILFCVRGSTTGRMNIADKNYAIGRGLAAIRHKSEPKFNCYIKSVLEFMLPQLLQSSTGSTFPNVSRSDFDAITISIPSIEEQFYISSFFECIDNKIDLLHRQNKSLEQLAEILFRQWFVEGKHNNAKIVSISDLGKVICGKTPSKSIPEYFGGDIPFIKIPDMHGNTFVFNTEDSLSVLGKDSQGNKVIPPRSICVSCIATVGLVAMNSKEALTNQQINSIVPYKESYRYYIYLLMLSLKDELLAMASGGTATDNLNTGDFSKIQISFPGEIIVKEFHNGVEPFFSKIFQNQVQQNTLIQLRDALLPKLMSGEVRVKI